MGLDMYVFRAKKPANLNPDIIYEYEGLQEKKYSLFDAEEVEKERMLKELIPVSVKVTCANHYYNIDKIQKEFQIGENVHWSGFDQNGVHFRGDKGKIVIEEKNIEKYCIEKDEEYYVTQLKEVAYWRKNYELQSALYNEYNNRGTHVENCGYYQIDDDIIKIINKNSNRNFGLEEYEKGTLFYHEWY